MSGHRRDRYGKTLEDRVWYWLGKNPGARPKDVMAHFEIKKAAASHCLRRLTWKGSATVVGKTHAVRYTATSQRPDDLRGTSINTLLTLQKHTVARRKEGSPQLIRFK